MAVGDGGVRVEVLMLPRLQRYRRDAGRNRPVLHLAVSCPRGVRQISGQRACSQEQLVASVAARNGVLVRSW